MDFLNYSSTGIFWKGIQWNSLDWLRDWKNKYLPVDNGMIDGRELYPQYKRKGYGKILLDYSLEKAAELGCGALCFEGNIDFYGKSGFKQASEYGIRYHGLPEGEDASFFLCKELIPGYFDGITGEYATPEGYLVDEQEAEEFDKQFPYKAKKKLPRQIF